MRIHILTNSPKTNSGYATVVKNLAPELVKLGYNVAITGMQNAYTMESYKDIPIYPIMSNFHEANNIQVQMHRLMMNIQHHKSDVLMCHFQGDSMYNPFTQVFPNVIWYIPIEGEIVYKNHSLIRDAKKVKQVVAQTKAGHNELAKKGIKSETIYHGYAPTIFKKGWDHELEEEVIVYYPVKKSEIRLSIQDIPKIREMMGAGFVVGFVGQNFGVRKRIERLIEAFSIFADGKKDVLLHLHCMPAHIRGVNLFEFIEYFDIADKVIFSYGDFISSGWSDAALNVLYNSFDIFASATSAEGFGLCLAPDTKIETQSGIKAISEIKTGDKVLTHTGNYQEVLEKMKRTYQGEMLGILAYGMNKPINITPEHPVYAVKRPKQKYKHSMGEAVIQADPMFISAKDLNIGDLVIFPKPKIVESLQDKIDLAKIDAELEKDDKYVWYKMGYSGTTSKTVKYLRYISLDSRFAKIIGIYIAEGSTNKNQLSSIEISLHRNELDLANEIGVYFLELFGKSYKVSIKGNKLRLIISGRIIAKLLSQLCGLGAHNKHIPRILFSNIELLKSCIEYIIKGDGHHHKKSGRVELTTVSEGLAHDVKLALIMLGKAPSYHFGKSSSKFKSSDIYRIFYYENNKICHSNKSYNNTKWVAYYIRKINKFQYSGEVYNLETKNDNSYTTCCFTVHNCHLETMPAGVPQVVPDFPPMDEFCGNDERGLRAKGMKQLSSSQSGELRFLVDPKDMAAKMQILYDDKALREKMGKNCQQWVQSYTWPKIAAKFDKVFRSM